MMNWKVYFVGILAISLYSCQSIVQKEKQSITIDLQGHRGARGLMPENTIPAFMKALEYNKVTTLELDLAVTKDNQLVVSHEPWFNPTICSDSLGNELSEDQKISIYKMSYEEIVKFDCGSKGNPRFPNQIKQSVTKPLLKDVIKAVNKELNKKEIEHINYNIEIKSLPEGDELYHPSPSEFSDIVYKFLKENMDANFVTIQSFDFRVLKYFHSMYPEIKLVALIEDDKEVSENLAKLGFSPDVYSPYYITLSKDRIEELHSKNIQVIPWTVNDTTEMKKLIDWKVDGIITDYPNLAQKILE